MSKQRRPNKVFRNMNEEQHTHKDQGCDDESSGEEVVETSGREGYRNKDEKPAKSLFQQWRKLTIDRRVESSVAALGLLIAVFVAFVALNQLEAMIEQTKSMQGQLAEMKSGSADTKAIAESAKTQAENTKVLVSAAIDQVQQLAAGVEETKKLALSTQGALSIAKDTEKRQLRAYVVIGRMDLQRFGVGNIAHVEGLIENIGQTPAHDAGWQSGINILDYRVEPTFRYDDCSVIRKLPEYPRWSFGKNSPVDKDRLTAFTTDEINHIQNGMAAIYLHGRLCYLDIFEEEHFTDFCVYWKWENGRLGIGIRCPKSDKAT
jgi:hypothetical protein